MVNDPVLEATIAALRAAGARFAFLFGSRAEGTAKPESDLDVAAWFGRARVLPWEIRGLPDGVDVVVLDGGLDLTLAGRIALHGRLLFDDDPPARVEWQATTRRVYLDEVPRLERARRDFVEGARRRGRR